MATTEVAVERQKKYVSERGAFEIVSNPEITPRYSWQNTNIDNAMTGWGMEPLVEKYGEDPVREKLSEMFESLAGGMKVTRLFGKTRSERTSNSMSIVHIWIGSHFPLFRHGHPAAGDCLYHVVAGELMLGRRGLRTGSSFFLPNGMPYKYSGGPNGAELLEIRAGAGEEGTPGMVFHETSLDSIQRIIDIANEHSHKWHAPENIGDTALHHAENLFEAQITGS